MVCGIQEDGNHEETEDRGGDGKLSGNSERGKEQLEDTAAIGRREKIGAT